MAVPSDDTRPLMERLFGSTSKFVEWAVVLLGTAVGAKWLWERVKKK